jgi:DNA-binding NarL/FixJ family response regulator
MPRTYSILLAGANPLLREKLAGVLTRSKTFWCVIQVDGRGNLARAAAQTQPDFILADLAILKDQEMNRFLRRTSAESRIVALVDSKLEAYMKAARELGLDGIIESGRAGEEIRSIIGALEEKGGDGS